MAEIKEPAGWAELQIASLEGTLLQLRDESVEQRQYIERLEQAVLKLWHDGMEMAEGEWSYFVCRLCRDDPYMANHHERTTHAEDCMVPALIAKHEGRDGIS